MKNDEIFHSWKEIAVYLSRDVRTCLRWEKDLNLPVHRINKHSSHSKVFAYKSEIDNWLQEKADNSLIKPVKTPYLKNIYISIFLSAAVIAIGLVYINFPKIPGNNNSDILSMAVFPFQSNTPSIQNNSYFAEGIVNEIAKSLTNHNSIKVIPIYLSDSIKNQGKNPLEIGMDLGVQYLLTGLVKKQDSNINVMIKIIRVEDEKQLWSHEYEEQIDKFYSLRNQISSNICECLKIKPNFQTQGLIGLKDMTGGMWDSYFLANKALTKISLDESDPEIIYSQGKSFSVYNTRETNEIAINSFQKVLELNENFAPAYVGLAECFINNVNFSWDFNLKWLNHAEKLLEKAQALHPNLPEYFTFIARITLLRSVYFNQKIDRQPMNIAEEGLKYYPYNPELNSIMATCYYHRYGKTGNELDLVTSMEFREKCHNYNPISFQNIKYAELLLLNKKFELAIEICRSLHDLDASGLIKFLLGQIYYYKGDLEEAEKIFLTFKGTSQERSCSLLYQAMIAAQKGEFQRAANLIKDIKLLKPTDNYFDSDLNLASIYIGLGNLEKGYEYLRSFFDQDSTKNQIFIYLKYIELDKNFDAIRDSIEFKNIILPKKEELWVKVNQFE